MTQPDHLEKPPSYFQVIGTLAEALGEITLDQSPLFPQAGQSVPDNKKIIDAVVTRMDHEMILCMGQAATLENAEAFLLGRDPVPTSPEYTFEAIVASRGPEMGRAMTTLHFKAAITAGNILLLDAMFPREFSDKTTPYPQVLNSLWQKNYLKDKIDFGHGEMDATAMLELYRSIGKPCHKRLITSNMRGVPLDKDSLNQLVKAADAHNIAGAELRWLASTDAEYTSRNRRSALGISTMLRRNSTLLRQHVAHNALLNGPNEIDTKRLAIGLRERWMAAGGVLHEEARRDNPSGAKANLQHMVDTLQSIFVDGKALDAMSVGEAKGLLYELLWMVDANMLILSNPDYSDISVWPAPLHADYPRINKPDLNHGIDYIVTRGVSSRTLLEPNGDVYQGYHQLKSGSQDSKTYHPRITLVIDKEFRGDLDKRRLSTRLNMYSKLIASGFQDSHEMKRFLGDDKTKPYLLKGVREALEEARSSSK